MFRPQTPADGPSWLPAFARSVANLFRQQMPRPFWLWGAATADLPTLAEMGANEGALAYDETLGMPTWYDGEAWQTLASAAGMEMPLEAFGAKGDGSTNDLVALKAAVAFQKAQAALGVKWKLVGRGPDATYYVGSFNYSTAVVIDYNDCYIDWRGAKIKFAQGNATGFIRFDYIEYVTGVNEVLRGPVTIINGDYDFDKGAPFCCALFFRYSGWTDIDLSGSIFRQSGNGTSPDTGDQWGVALENYTALNIAGTWTDAADANARLHNITMENCESYNAVQLTSGAGRGVNGVRIINPYVFEPRANGIAITGISRVTRLDDIKILGATVIRATGNAIYVNCDNIGNSFASMIGEMPSFQHYCRGLVIDDYNLIDCFEGIRVGHYAQGGYDIVIGDGNISNHASGVAVERTDGLTVTASAGIRSDPLAMHWAIDYHGGTDPVITDAAFDAATNTVTLTAHNIPTCGGVTITGAAGDTMPPGLPSGVPLTVKSETANTFTLWWGVDEATGLPVNQVNFAAGASGDFTVSFATIVQNMTITDGANVTGGASGAYLGSIRDSKINGSLGLDFNFGAMVGVEVGASFESGRNTLGGTLRVAFRGGSNLVPTVSASTADYIMKVADSAAYLPNYDIEFIDWHVIVAGTGAVSTTYPRFFLKDAVTLANRRGRGWAATNVTFTLDEASTSFAAFSAANPDNCWKFIGDGYQQTGTEMFGGIGAVAKPFRFLFKCTADFGNVVAGATATVTVTCTGARLAEDSKFALRAYPLTQKADFDQMKVSVDISADDTLRFTAANFAALDKNPASANWLVLAEGYR